MLPLFDENPTRRRPLATWAIIGICVALFAASRFGVGVHPVALTGPDPVEQLPAEIQFPLEWAAVPCEVLSGRPLTVAEVTATYYGAGGPASCEPDADEPGLFPGKWVRAAMLSSLFLHASVFHLALNMLFLWVFGNNVEDRLGHPGFVAFYLVGGVVSTVAYVAAQPTGTLAILGASGAVATVMGAYLVWYPDAPIRTLLFLILVDIRARWFLGLWFLMQFFTWREPGAWIAHVAGFVYGAIAGQILRKTLPRLRLRPGQQPPAWDRTGGAGHGPYPHLREVWDDPHRGRFG
jgi:membrane associated rhomboid family serine protease